MQSTTNRTLSGLAVLLLSSTFLAGVANADDVYQWKDANGVMHYSQVPPANTAYKTQTGNGYDEPSAPVPVAAKPEAENPQCVTARKNIELLESKQAVQQDTDGDGKPDKTLDDAGRSSQLELARATLKANCAAAPTGSART
jgi:hypothetical protein